MMISRVCRRATICCKGARTTILRNAHAFAATACLNTPQQTENPLVWDQNIGNLNDVEIDSLNEMYSLAQKKATMGPSELARCPVIEPRFWTGEPSTHPSEYEIDCSNYDMEAKDNPELVAKMMETYDRVGLVMLRNTGLTDLNEMSRWADVLISERHNYTGGANSRGAIEENVYDTGAPKEAHIHYHHEMAYLNKSVKQVAFCASAAIDDGTTRGAMFLADSMKATEEVLATPLGQKLKELGICYVRCLTDREAFKDKAKGWNGLDEVGVYNHWQRSFGTDNPDEAEALALQKGLQVDWGPNRYMRTKFYTDVFEYAPCIDKNTIYASVADDAVWHDTWPGVMELPSMESPDESTMHQRPLKITFGDDSEFTREELRQFIDIYDNHGLPLNWKTGDVAIICNWRWLHGRPPYHLEEGEERTLGVLLGPVFERKGQYEDKW